MGNYKFKLSDMIPNAWFYKLRDIGKTRKQNTTPSRKKKQSPLTSTTQQSSKPNQPHQCNNPRKSYYFTRELDPTSNKIYTSPSNTPKFSPDPPRKSSKQRRTKKRTITKSYSPKVVNSSVSSGCNFHTTLESVWTNKLDSPPHEYSYSSSQFDSSTESEFPDPEFRTDRVLLPVNTTKNLSYTYRHKQDNYNSSSNNDDIVIDVDKNSLAKRKDGYEFDSFSEVELPPIITKPVINDDVSQKETKPREQQHNKKGSMKVKIVKENTSTIKEQRNSPVRRFSMSSSKVKVHVNSPRIERRKVHSHGRKIALSSSSGRSLSDSFAIVKSSFNPQKDFRESMMEMIVENNLRGSKDLEDLLACYLSLNSDEYHDIIIKVFKQIWFDFTEKR